MTTEQRMRGLLRQAQAGDEDAHREVALYVFNRFKDRLRRLYSLDPSVSQEDLEMTFFEAIMRHVPLADGRGDDFYHLGQRGFWAAQSEIRAVKAMVSRRVFLRETPDDMTFEEQIGEDRTAVPACDIVHEQLGAAQTVRVISTAPLRGRAREAIDRILTDQTLNPAEPGFNKALARRMGVSPQRASQILAQVRAEVGIDGT